MNPSARATQLRRRAGELRDFADQIERSPVMRLDRYGEEDTWRGVRPTLCRTTLATNQQQLLAAADDLRWTAYRFVQRAEEIESVARVLG